MWPALFKGGSLFNSIAWRDAAVAAAMTIGCLAIAANDAEAAPSPGCVTKTEYRQVHRGDTLKRVARIFDTPGLRVSIAAYGGLKIADPRLPHLQAEFGRAHQFRQRAGQNLPPLGQVGRLGRLSTTGRLKPAPTDELGQGTPPASLCFRSGHLGSCAHLP